jgi:3-hydroxyacyl-CoA dehydrogenase
MKPTAGIDCGPLMPVFTAAVVGAGTMGAGIAQAIADAGIPVVLKDLDQGALNAGLARARSIWEGRVQAGRLEATELEARLALIEPASDYAPFGRVDIVIEAVPERLELKQAVFSELDEVTPGHAILSSNTSALSITELSEATTRPDRVLGLHFFYPAPTMRAVEVVEGEYSSAEALAVALQFLQAIRKLAIRSADAPGFIVNRILNSSASEVWRFQSESGVDPAAIDRALTDAKVAPIGPFHLADLVGLDTALGVADHLEDSYGERFFVHPGMRERVARGELGVKTGRGFYEHRG